MPIARIYQRGDDSNVARRSSCFHPQTPQHFPVSCASIHDHVSQTGSNGAAELSEWTATVSWRGLMPSQASIFAIVWSGDGVVVVESVCDKHERPTVVRRDIHQTRLGVRSFRGPLRARQRGCARSCSTLPNIQCCPLTIMGGAAVTIMSSCPEELRGHSMDQARPAGTSTAEGSGIMTWAGRPASLACGRDLQLLFSSNGDVVRATSSLLSRGPLASRHAVVGWKGLTP